jgi:hypothetical protein
MFQSFNHLQAEIYNMEIIRLTNDKKVTDCKEEHSVFCDLCSPLEANSQPSETLVDFRHTTRCYIPDDRTLYNHCCEYLKSYKIVRRYECEYSYGTTLTLEAYLTTAMIFTEIDQTGDEEQ